jgi:hypothetical protein
MQSSDHKCINDPTVGCLFCHRRVRMLCYLDIGLVCRKCGRLWYTAHRFKSSLLTAYTAARTAPAAGASVLGRCRTMPTFNESS